jgi:hypothetical protein
MPSAITTSSPVMVSGQIDIMTFPAYGLER